MADDSNDEVGEQETPPNPALGRLAVLVGEWAVEITAISGLEDPATVAQQGTSFEWMEGGKFLLQRSEPQRTEFPRSTSIIGPDDAAGTYTMLYFDSRGVSRVYQMSLADGVWKLWRDFHGFSQRFKGTFNADRTVIQASWAKSADGITWEHDFDMKYTRVAQETAT